MNSAIIIYHLSKALKSIGYFSFCLVHSWQLTERTVYPIEFINLHTIEAKREINKDIYGINNLYKGYLHCNFSNFEIIANQNHRLSCLNF